MSTEVASKAPGQLRGLLPRGASAPGTGLRVVVGLLVALRAAPPARCSLAAVAVLVAQLIMGLVNDLLDVDRDQRSGRAGQAVAEGLVPPGNASFAVAVLLLLVIPLSLQNGTAAGLFLLATLVVGLVHNRWLHTTALSWVGWAATFALLTYFVTLGGWGREADGSRAADRLRGALRAARRLRALPDLAARPRRRQPGRRTQPPAAGRAAHRGAPLARGEPRW